MASAGNDINLMAAVINSASSTSLAAGHDVNLSTVKTSLSNNIIWDAKNHLNQMNTQDNGTQMTSATDINITAGNDVNVKAATVTSSHGAINATAGKGMS